METILASTKKLSGVGTDYSHFDADLIMYINSVFLVLKQLGVGPAKGFVISDEEATWNEFIPDDDILRESVKTYMAAKVRLQFDPPVSSSHVQVLKDIINEYEWRLNIEAEFPTISS